MALVMYFTKAPRYKNTTVKEIKLIESYLQWQHEKQIGSRYGSATFKKWCGRSEDELPDKTAIEYYEQFLTERTTYVEGVGHQESCVLFEQIARFVKANQIFNWFVKNIMNNKADQEFYEVTKNKLENLLNACNELKNNFTFVGKNKYDNEDIYSVNETVAKEIMPFMNEKGYFFGPSNYNELYANQIIELANIVSDILATTDFEKQAVYFNAIW